MWKNKKQYAVDTVCHPKSLKYSLSDRLKKKVSDPVLDDSRPKYYGAGTSPPYCALSKCLNHRISENNKIALFYFRKDGVICYALIGNHTKKLLFTKKWITNVASIITNCLWQMMPNLLGWYGLGYCGFGLSLRSSTCTLEDLFNINYLVKMNFLFCAESLKV